MIFLEKLSKKSEFQISTFQKVASLFLNQVIFNKIFNCKTKNIQLIQILKYPIS